MLDYAYACSKGIQINFKCLLVLGQENWTIHVHNHLGVIQCNSSSMQISLKQILLNHASQEHH